MKLKMTMRTGDIMREDIKDFLKNCLVALNNATEEDIAKMQKVYDEEVGRYSKYKNDTGFEVIFNPRPFSDEELVELLGKDFMDSLTNLK